MTNGYYSKEIKTPKTAQEGLANFVQMVINQIEAGQADFALLTAVDLLNDLQSEASPYKLADKAGAKLAGLQKELEGRHQAEIISATERAFEDGRSAMRNELVSRLGLAA